MKKLELGNILIHDVQFSNEGSKVENGVLYVNKEEICKIALEDGKTSHPAKFSSLVQAKA